MSEINDGGPAFPACVAEIQGVATNSAEFALPGMSLRDYFAAKALTGYMANSQDDGCEPTLLWMANPAHDIVEVASVCYRIADAMLKAREAK